MVRVLIFEPHATGHHANYLRWLLQAARRKQWSIVVATTSSAMDHPALAAIRAEFDEIHFHSIRDCSNVNGIGGASATLFWRGLCYWRSFEQGTREVHSAMPVDLVILPYVDYCFYALAILGSPFRGIPWCGISMRLAVAKNTSAAPASMTGKWRAAKRILGQSSLRALFVINPSVQDVPGHWMRPDSLSKLRYLPDPAEYEATVSRADARAALGFSQDGIAILIFGSIDERKGLDSLIASLTSESNLGDYMVIVAGKQSAGIQNDMLTPTFAELSAQRRLIALNRFCSDAELGLLLAAADVVWVGYRDHVYMSGVLVLAGRAGLPVIGTADGEIGRFIAECEVGMAVKTERPEEVAHALRVLLNDGTRREMGQRARLVFADHTVERFGTTVLEACIRLSAV